MTTPLHSTLKRALTIEGREYVVTLSETTLKITLKGKRNGVELPWAQLVNGDAALAVALHASLGAFATKDRAPPTEEPAHKRPMETRSTERHPTERRPTEKRLTEKRSTEKRPAVTPSAVKPIRRNRSAARTLKG
jgi:hypothetical protein